MSLEDWVLFRTAASNVSVCVCQVIVALETDGNMHARIYVCKFRIFILVRAHYLSNFSGFPKKTHANEGFAYKHTHTYIYARECTSEGLPGIPKADFEI